MILPSVVLFNKYSFAVMRGGKYYKQVQVEPVPSDLDFNKYSALMGLLATNGASLRLGFNWYWDYRTVYLRLSNSNLEFLDWLVGSFNCSHFQFDTKKFNRISSSNSIQIGSLPSEMCYVLWLHWNQVGTYVLPFHFAEYFTIRTLATWSMRNGQWKGNSFIINVSRLNESEKGLLMSLIKDKLGYESRLTMKNNKLAISSPEQLVRRLAPYFHESQLYRLTKVS